MRRPLIVLLAVALVALVAIGLSQAGGSGGDTAASPPPSLAAAQRALAGSPAPLAALHRQADAVLGGGPDAFRARLRALRGYPAVVNIWASWCAPCRLEFPVLQHATAKLGRRVAFLAVDHQNNRADALAFLRAHPVPYPSYADTAGSVLRTLGAQGLPTTVFYDRRGRVAFVHQGPYASGAALVRDVRRYLRVA